MKRSFLLLLLSVMPLSGMRAEVFDYEKIADHPRLLLRDGSVERIKKMIRSKGNKDLLYVHHEIIAIADQTLNEKPCKWPGEGHILATSRRILRRVFNSSYAYLLTGYHAYADRAEQEILNACDFPHWDPDHFLDTAEMCFAMAIAYDWLYDYLSEKTKEIIEQNIIEKAIKPSYEAGFYEMSSNWNQVCNSGIVAGCLAIFEKIPQIAEERIAKSVATNPLALASYAPHGGYPEGYTYWGYGTGYNVLMFAMLESALGNDAGLSHAEGFLQTSEFMQFMTTPAGNCFGFADSNPSAACNIMQFWFASKRNMPSLLYLERKLLSKGDPQLETWKNVLPSMMVFASDMELAGNVAPPVRNTWFNAGPVPLYLYRGGWDSEEDTYVGVKGGKCRYSHAHMDIGNFVFEKGGVMWATDVGTQSYGTFYKNGVDVWNFTQDSQRWDIWRYCNQMHNIITVNGGRQNVDAFASIEEVYDTPQKRGCRVDLDGIYSLQLAGAERHVWLSEDETLHVQDFLVTKPGHHAEVSWNMVTRASAEITGKNTICLTKGKHRVEMTVKSPSDVEMYIKGTDSPFSWDLDNPGTLRVGFRTVLPPDSECKLDVELVYFKK